MKTSVSISAVMEASRPWQKRMWLGRLFCLVGRKVHFPSSLARSSPATPSPATAEVAARTSPQTSAGSRSPPSPGSRRSRPSWQSHRISHARTVFSGWRGEYHGLSVKLASVVAAFGLHGGVDVPEDEESLSAHADVSLGDDLCGEGGTSMISPYSSKMEKSVSLRSSIATFSFRLLI
jgi:hypothetical protein